MLRQKLRQVARSLGRLIDMPLELRGSHDELLDAFGALRREVMGTLASVRKLEEPDATGFSVCSWFNPPGGPVGLCLGSIYRTREEAEAYLETIGYLNLNYTVVPVYFPIPWEKAPPKVPAKPAEEKPE